MMKVNEIFKKHNKTNDKNSWITVSLAMYNLSQDYRMLNRLATARDLTITVSKI